MLPVFSKLPLSKAAHTVAVRPRLDSGDTRPQVLVFLKDEVFELLEVFDENGVKTFRLSEQRLPIAGPFTYVSAAIYEPISECIFFADDSGAIKRLDRNNVISLVAGSEQDVGSTDGRGGDVRFVSIVALAADGKGNIFIADGQGPSRIRLLRVRTGEVVTLRGSENDDSWNALSYDAAAGVLVAATTYAVCHVLMYGSEDSSLGLCAATRLVAGDWDDGEEFIDGGCGGARFAEIDALLAGANSRVHVCDSRHVSHETRLRVVEPDGTVGTAAVFDMYTCTRHNVAVLPAGELALCIAEEAPEDGSEGEYQVQEEGGGDWDMDKCSSLVIISDSGFIPSSEVLIGLRPLVPPADVAVRTALPGLLALPDAGSSGTEGSGAAVGSIVVTVRVGHGGKAFTAHRSVLAAGSEYFERKLAEDGGFGDSGAAEVFLPDAHPDAFGWLLSYCYTGTLDVPDELLRPAAELAGLLLLPADCRCQLTARLLAATTPQSVVGDLVWAEEHGMAELVSQLKAYLLRHRKAVAAADPRALEGLAALCGRTRHSRPS